MRGAYASALLQLLHPACRDALDAAGLLDHPVLVSLLERAVADCGRMGVKVERGSVDLVPHDDEDAVTLVIRKGSSGGAQA